MARECLVIIFTYVFFLLFLVVIGRLFNPNAMLYYILADLKLRGSIFDAYVFFYSTLIYYCPTATVCQQNEGEPRLLCKLIEIGKKRWNVFF